MEHNEFYPSLFLALMLGAPALFALRSSLQNLKSEKFPASLRFLDISTAIGIYFLYLVGYAIALVVLLHLAVDIKTNFLIFKYGRTF